MLRPPSPRLPIGLGKDFAKFDQESAFARSARFST